MAQEFIINDGTKEYTLKNQMGAEIGKIRFNPTDVNFISRVNTFADRFQALSEEADKIVQLYEDKDIAQAGMATAELDAKIKAEVDMIFNSPVSAIVFGDTNCLSTVNGVPFVERFINAVLPEFKNTIIKENKAQQQKINKYTAKYAKRG